VLRFHFDIPDWNFRYGCALAPSISATGALATPSTFQIVMNAMPDSTFFGCPSLPRVLCTNTGSRKALQIAVLAHFSDGEPRTLRLKVL
jgi:hypothetical protein